MIKVLIHDLDDPQQEYVQKNFLWQWILSFIATTYTLTLAAHESFVKGDTFLPGPPERLFQDLASLIIKKFLPMFSVGRKYKKEENPSELNWCVD